MGFENKHHWYDGKFYDKFIAPNQDRIYSVIKRHIENGSSILDVGCGTGRLASALAGHYSKYTGVDPSIKNIGLAEHLFRGATNIEFIHSDIQTYSLYSAKKFDYAVITYVIHEVARESRIEILKSMSQLAKTIIIGEYLIPRPNGFWAYLNEAVEFAAGREHYKNFKDFEKGNGIHGLIENSNLNVIKEIKNIPKTAHVAVLKQT